MLEHHRAPLLPGRQFMARVARFAAVAAAIVLGSLALGVVGYHTTEGLPWLDAFHEASMILAGEGPVHPSRTSAGKLFASFYALFSGVAFLSTVAVLMAPVVHRLLHRFHIERDSGRR